VTNITIDGSEAMFTTMCALYASGFEGDVSADNWSTFRSRIREQMRQQQGPAVDAVRAFYSQHRLKDPGAMLSRYVWFGLVSGPAPKFQPVLRRDELPPEVISLEGFSEILSDYYKEQKIGLLWRQVQPVYNKEIERLHDPVSQIVLVASTYLREMMDPTQDRTFTIIVEPLVGRITNVRNYGDHYAIILSGNEDIPLDVVRHAFLHFLLDPLPLMYSHVVVVKLPIFEQAAKAPRLAPDLKDDFSSWFSECMVRAVELKLRRLSPGEKEAALNADDADGYVLVRPLFNALPAYEKTEPSMKNYFPDMVRSINVQVEEKRVAAIKFAPAETAADSQQLSSEEVARRQPPAVTTVPNDQDTITELTEGEKRIAERNPQAAEASFKSVLAKYPDQIRAWYGLGLVALLNHDAAQAKAVFGRLTTGEHAATKDPMVMAWSHVYLGRIYDDEGQLDRAKSEYQAALAVQGAPSQAQQAAQKGLGDLDTRKPLERP
jgi:tetratricopeptide (TPR) repeat protein